MLGHMSAKRKSITMNQEQHKEFRDHVFNYQMYKKVNRITDIDFLLIAARLVSKSIENKQRNENEKSR